MMAKSSGGILLISLATLFAPMSILSQNTNTYYPWGTYDDGESHYEFWVRSDGPYQDQPISVDPEHVYGVACRVDGKWITDRSVLASLAARFEQYLILNRDPSVSDWVASSDLQKVERGGQVFWIPTGSLGEPSPKFTDFVMKHAIDGFTYAGLTDYQRRRQVYRRIVSVLVIPESSSSWSLDRTVGIYYGNAIADAWSAVSVSLPSGTGINDVGEVAVRYLEELESKLEKLPVSIKGTAEWAKKYRMVRKSISCLKAGQNAITVVGILGEGLKNALTMYTKLIFATAEAELRLSTLERFVRENPQVDRALADAVSDVRSDFEALTSTDAWIEVVVAFFNNRSLYETVAEKAVEKLGELVKPAIEKAISYVVSHLGITISSSFATVAATALVTMPIAAYESWKCLREGDELLQASVLAATLERTIRTGIQLPPRSFGEVEYIALLQNMRQYLAFLFYANFHDRMGKWSEWFNIMKEIFTDTGWNEYREYLRRNRDLSLYAFVYYRPDKYPLSRRIQELLPVFCELPQPTPASISIDLSARSTVVGSVIHVGVNVVDQFGTAMPGVAVSATAESWGYFEGTSTTTTGKDGTAVFSYVPMETGDHVISVCADGFGVCTSSEPIVVSDPSAPHDVRISTVKLSQYQVKVGTAVNVLVTVENGGEVEERNIKVHVELLDPRHNVVDTKTETISLLDPGQQAETSIALEIESELSQGHYTVYSSVEIPRDRDQLNNSYTVGLYVGDPEDSDEYYCLSRMLASGSEIELLGHVVMLEGCNEDEAFFRVDNGPRTRVKIGTMKYLSGGAYLIGYSGFYKGTRPSAAFYFGVPTHRVNISPGTLVVPQGSQGRLVLEILDPTYSFSERDPRTFKYFRGPHVNIGKEMMDWFSEGGVSSGRRIELLCHIPDALPAGTYKSWVGIGLAPHGYVFKIWRVRVEEVTHDIAVVLEHPDNGTRVKPGDNVRVRSRVVNNGDVTEVVRCEISIAGQQGAAGYVWEALSPELRVAPGETATLDTTWETKSLPGGRYSVLVRADIPGDIVEADNHASVSLELISLVPQLSLSTTTVDVGSGFPGYPFATVFSVRNSGEVDLRGRVIPLTGGILTGVDPGEFVVEPHETVEVRLSGTFPLEFGQFSAKIAVVSDGGSRVIELTGRVLEPAPTIVVSPDTISLGYSTEGSSFRSSITISNASPVQVQYRAEATAPWVQSITPDSGTLKAGGIETIEISGIVPRVDGPFEGVIVVEYGGETPCSVVLRGFSSTEGPGQGGELLVYYPFRGNLQDLSGNEHHLIQHGQAALTQDRFGHSDDAIRLDGLDDYFHVVGLGYPASGSRSYCLWVRNEEHNSFGPLLEFYDPPDKRFLIGNDSNDKLSVQFANWNRVEKIYLSKRSFYGTWNFIVVTVDGRDNVARIYIDGALVHQMDIEGCNPDLPGASLIMGYDPEHDDYFEGCLDDVRIYDRVLSADEIQQLYTEGGWGNHAPVLVWTGEKGYENDGVDPDEAQGGTIFQFRVKYQDEDGDEPAQGYPKVHVLKAGVEIPGSPFAMSPAANGDVRSGKIYTFDCKLFEAGQDYSYFFEARDKHGNAAVGDATSPQAGPVVEPKEPEEPAISLSAEHDTVVLGNAVKLTASVTPAREGYPLDFQQDPTRGVFDARNPVLTDSAGKAVVQFLADRPGSADIYAVDANNPANFAKTALTIVRPQYNFVFSHQRVGIIGNEVAYDVTVRVTDSDGNPVYNFNYTFTTDFGHWENGQQSISNFSQGDWIVGERLFGSQNGEAHVTINVEGNEGEYSFPVQKTIPSLTAFRTVSVSNAHSLSFAPNDDKVAFTSADRVKIYDLSEGRVVNDFPFLHPENDRVTTQAYVVRYSPDGQRLLVGSQDGFRILRASDGQSLAANGNVIISPDSKWGGDAEWVNDETVVVAGPNGAYALRASDLGVIRTLFGSAFEFTDVDAAGPHVLLGASGDHEEAYLLSRNSWSQVRVYNPPGNGSDITAVALSPGGEYSLVSDDYDQLLYLYDNASGNQQAQLSGGSDAWSLDWNPAKDNLVLALHNNTVAIWDVAAGNILQSAPASSDGEAEWGMGGLVFATIGGGKLQFFAPFDLESPTLTITFPPEGFSTSRDTATVEGYVGDDSGIGGASYRVSGSDWEELPLVNSSFSLRVSLAVGDNEITIRVCDVVGKCTSRTIRVRRVRVQNVPMLVFPTEGGFQDGVEPDRSVAGTSFEFRVVYKDQDGDPPANGYPKLHLLKGGNEISGSPFAMNPLGDSGFVEGRAYACTVVLQDTGSDYSYVFEAVDTAGNAAVGLPTAPRQGPVVVTPGGGGQPSAGLLAYYAFDGNSEDVSGGGNNAEAYGSPLYGPDRFGRANASALLDGQDDYFQVDGLGHSASGSRTYCLWAKNEEHSSFGMLLEFYDSPDKRFFIGNDTNDRLKVQFANGSGAQKTYISEQPFYGTWNFFVVTVDAQQNVARIYVDGELTHEMNIEGCNPNLPSAPLRMGHNPRYGDYFRGCLDDVRIYARVLSADEIRELYTEGGWGNHAPVLVWTGENGYENDGVDPDEAWGGTTFQFRVKYQDEDGDEPAQGYPKVHVLKAGVEIPGSPFAMTPVGNEDVRSGRGYTFDCKLSEAGGHYSYFFEAKDTRENDATGVPTAPQDGPVVLRPANLLRGLVAYYPLDETLEDAFGSNDWQDHGSVPSNQGVLNGCREFNRGTSGQYCQANSTSLDTAATLSFWFYSFGEQPAHAGVVFKAYGEPHGDQSIFGAQVENGHEIHLNAYGEKTAGGHLWGCLQTFAFEHNRWYHVVWTYSGRGGWARLYVNGQLVGQSDELGARMFNPTSKWKMGMQKWSSRSFHGRLDEIGIWSRSLTPQEVSALYNGGKGLPFPFGQEVNAAPDLTWLGEGGFASDGVDPDTAYAPDEFSFRVLYRDTDGDAPAEGYPRLHVLKSGEEINGSPFGMEPLVQASWQQGCPFGCTVALDQPGSDYSYYIEAKDAQGAQASGPATQLTAGPVVLEAEKHPPAWTVDPSSFQYNMSIIGVLSFDGEESADPNDLVAAFVGEELRGVAHPTLFQETGRYTFGLVVYSNAQSGETIRFEAYDYSSDQLYRFVPEKVAFNADEVVGSDLEPLVLHAQQRSTRRLQLALRKGWNWFSINLILPEGMGLGQVLRTLAGKAVFIKDQTKFAQYYEGYGWYSSNGLDRLRPETMYMIRMSDDASLDVEGFPVGYDTVQIALQAGWNWIGFLPQDPMPLSEALASIEGKAEFIKNQTAFANYYEGYGWYSSNGLDQLVPGEGYMLRVSDNCVLVFGKKTAGGMAKEHMVGRALSMGPWKLNPSQYEHNMAITGSVEIDGTECSDSLLVVGAFVQDECRGLARLVRSPLDGRYIFGMLVYGQEGDTVRFRVYRSAEEPQYFAQGKLAFSVDGIVGDAEQPYRLVVRTSDFVDGTGSPSETRLYANFPNPFNAETRIRYDVSEPGMVRLTIYNVKGEVVRRLAEGHKAAGRYLLTWDGRDDAGGLVPSGLYLCRLEVAGRVEVRKLLFTR